MFDTSFEARDPDRELSSALSDWQSRLETFSRSGGSAEPQDQTFADLLSLLSEVQKLNKRPGQSPILEMRALVNKIIAHICHETDVPEHVVSRLSCDSPPELTKEGLDQVFREFLESCVLGNDLETSLQRLNRVLAHCTALRAQACNLRSWNLANDLVNFQGRVKEYICRLTNKQCQATESASK